MPVLLDFLSVPFLAIFALVTSYEDARFGRIRNKWIVAAMAYAVAALVAQVLFLVATGAGFNPGYILSFAINALLSVSLGVILWLAKLWTAADAKLFFAYACAVPLHWYRRVLFPSFPGLSLLVTAVLPLAVFYGAAAAIRLVRGRDAQPLRSALRQGLEPRKHAGMLLFIFGFSWLVNWVLVSVIREGGLLMLISGMLFLFWLCNRYLSRWLLHLSALASVARLALDAQSLLSPGFLLQFLAMYLFVAVVFILLLNVSRTAFCEFVPADRLREGMIPAEDVGGAAHSSEGLSAEEVGRLKAFGKDVRIWQSLPFAPFMAAGVLLASLSGGDLLLLL